MVLYAAGAKKDDGEKNSQFPSSFWNLIKKCSFEKAFLYKMMPIMLQLIPFDIGDVDKLLINYIHLIKGCTIAKGKHLSMKIHPFLATRSDFQ